VSFFNTLLQTVNRHAYLNKSDTVDQLYVVCVQTVTEMMTIDEALKVLKDGDRDDEGRRGIQSPERW